MNTRIISTLILSLLQFLRQEMHISTFLTELQIIRTLGRMAGIVESKHDRSLNQFHTMKEFSLKEEMTRGISLRDRV